jgi:hypothetical protein
MAEEHVGILPFTTPNGGADVPQWDSLNRKLYFRGELIKAFTSPADHQEAILAAFQARGWPPAIVNPLPGDTDEERHQRLERAVRRLNGKQRTRSLGFHVRGWGKNITWEIITQKSPVAGVVPG